jgi:hypothetical protein
MTGIALQCFQGIRSDETEKITARCAGTASGAAASLHDDGSGHVGVGQCRLPIRGDGGPSPAVLPRPSLRRMAPIQTEPPPSEIDDGAGELLRQALLCEEEPRRRIGRGRGR